MRVVVIGGGYAGLACLIELRSLAPRAELHLVDPAAAHLKQTRLQEALRRPLAELQVPFDELARRYRFEHHACAAGREGVFDASALRAWHDERRVDIGGEALAYDALVVATGARPRLRAAGAPDRVWDELRLREMPGEPLVQAIADASNDDACPVTIVGGGASGVQYAFELAEALRERSSRTRVRLLDAGTRLLASLPAAAGEYVRSRLQSGGIDYLQRTRYLGHTADAVRVQTADEDREAELPSRLTLLFGGVDAHPFELEANRYGQVVLDGTTLSNVYAAGDCVRYAARGLDAMTAQAAVRKGKHVAANITRIERGRAPIAYGYQEIGYVVSLGRFDSVGWLLVRENIVQGLAATALRGIVEAQYDLFVDGIDTYVL